MQAATAVTLHDVGLSGKAGVSVLEDQVGLPLNLVIALLKDLNGNISLNLPVEGRFDDPAFRLDGTILRAVRDVLIGAVTSPLKLLGAVFKGKEKIEDFLLEPIPFVPGTSQPTAAGQGQIARLRSFLAQRPELNLQISGHTGPEDLQALTDRLVLAQLQEQAEATRNRGPEAAEEKDAAPQVPPHAEVLQFLLQRVRSPDGEVSPLSVPAAALLAQLRAQMTVSSQAMKQLVEERVQTVIVALRENNMVAASRLQSSPEKQRGRERAEVHYVLQAQQG
jgi:hypothetical protein